MSALTLDAIWHIAVNHVPVAARYNDRLSMRRSWGPAHELAHALVASPKERTQRDFGLTCEPGMCRCPGEHCHVVELSAMSVSRRLVTAAGHAHLADVELQATPDYDMMVWSRPVRAARRLLVRRRLLRLPRTIAGLRQFVRDRLKEKP